MTDEFGIGGDDITETVDSVESTTDATAYTARGVYANQDKASAEGVSLRSQRGDSSDEVDPRKLVRDPTLSEIRWYYRRTFAKILVDKPIDDAFKNGFDFTGDNADEAQNMIENPHFDGEGEGFIGAYRLAEKKARRDGFALVFLGTRERGSVGINESPVSQDVDVEEVSHLKVLTIDDLSESAPHDEIQEGTGLEQGQYDIRSTGIVINTDINSPEYRTPVGYVLGGSDPSFIHKDRAIHLTWNPEVDGDYKGSGVRRWDGRRSTLGQYEGDSVLIPTYDILKGIAKGNWAIMQALFRNASHMYTVTLPEDADEEDQKIAMEETRNINAKSSLTFPHGYEVNQHDSGGEMEPEQHFQVLFDQVCAGHEMTKSVLFGTQAGTVSGSETDIKNYFNKVERFRTNRAESKIIEFLTLAKSMTDSRTSDDFQYEVEFDWGPMFKVDSETRVKMVQTATNAMATAIGQYILTPDEARNIISEEFTQIDLDDLTERQMDELDRIRLATSGQGPQALASEGEYTNSPSGEEVASGAGEGTPEQGGRESGMEQGQQTASEDPSAAGDATVEHIERLAELHDAGHLTEEEFQAAKESVLE